MKELFNRYQWIIITLFVFFLSPLDISAHDYSKLASKLTEILNNYRLDPQNTGIYFLDLGTGKPIFKYNENQILNPASNIKIITGISALYYLGPNFTYKTYIYGDVEDNKIKGDIILKGTGDPTLDSGDLWNIGYKLLGMGIELVEGNLLVDDTFFDNQDLPPAFEQKPDDYNSYRASVSGVSLNENTIVITIRPGSNANTPGIITTSAPGYMEIKNETITTLKGSSTIKIDTKLTAEGKVITRIWGNIPLGVSFLSYRKRVDNPSLMTGYAFKYILNQLGIKIKGKVVEGKLKELARPLIVHESPPLISFLWKLGKESNNFFAETLFKTIGAIKFGTPGTWEKGKKAIELFLEKEVGIKKESYKLINGSGLYDANRVSPYQLVKVLSYAWNNPKYREDFMSQLAIGGIDGTLSRRYKDDNIRGLVRAKTGTLEDVTALSGYAMDKRGINVIAFSIIINNIKGKVYLGRKLEEEMVTETIRFVNSLSERMK